MRSRLPAPVVVLLQAVAVVLLLTATGAVAGVLWNHLWDPPVGQVQQGLWGVTTEAGLRADFSGVALYVVVALAAGLVTGILSGLVLDRSELVTLVVLLASALLAGWVMWKVGVHRSPPDPRPLATGLADGATLPGHLRLHSRVPFISFPIGSLVGFALVLVSAPKRGWRADDDDTPATAGTPALDGSGKTAFPAPPAG